MSSPHRDRPHLVARPGPAIGQRQQIPLRCLITYEFRVSAAGYKLVELLGAYSRLGRQLGPLRRTVAMLEEGWSDQLEAPGKLARRVSMRLSPEQQLAVVREYQAGASGQQLAERYGVARSALVQFLRSRGVTVRRPRLTEEELAQIVALYRDGVRQVDIAERLDRDKAVVWHALRRVGEL